jgi:hypothetical protein
MEPLPWYQAKRLETSSQARAAKDFSVEGAP